METTIKDLMTELQKIQWIKQKYSKNTTLVDRLNDYEKILLERLENRINSIMK